MFEALATYWPAWLTPLVSTLALILVIANIVITMWRGARRVQMRMMEILTESDEGIFVNYRCQVTNTGRGGIQIDKVDLYPADGGNVAIPLRLRSGEKPRKLDQGEVQDWEICLRDLQGKSKVKGWLELVAVAADTTGKEYRQKRKDSMTVNLSDSLTINLAGSADRNAGGQTTSLSRRCQGHGP
jgi:hypothetical protein